jgi:hypothetical protein
MSHLTLEQLLALDEPGIEPDTVRARQHMEDCATCREEHRRLQQRRARLRAMPSLRPARDLWPAVQARRAREQQGRRTRWVGLGMLALAASLFLAFVVGRNAGRDEASLAAEAQLRTLMQRSQALEAAIGAYGPEGRVLDGRTSRVASDLEARIADVDDQLQQVELEPAPQEHEADRMRLWQERVGLLDALVDVHVTRASNVGL